MRSHCIVAIADVSIRQVYKCYRDNADVRRLAYNQLATHADLVFRDAGAHPIPTFPLRVRRYRANGRPT